MRIQTNIAALNSHRNIKKANTTKSKATDRLSSGLRIAVAADDAAGLAISEKMRAQIRGLKQAKRNVQDGISLIQTAEAGLEEVHESLHRMRELIIQASNAPLTQSDKKNITEELDHLLEHIDEIGASTEFNRMKILNAGAESTTIVSNEIEVTVGPGQTVKAISVEIPNPPDPENFWIQGEFGTISGAQWPDLNIISPLGESFGYSSDFLNSSNATSDTTNNSSGEAIYNGWGEPIEEMTFKNPVAGEWVVEIRNTGGSETSTYTIKSNYPLAFEYIEEEITTTNPTDIIIHTGPNKGDNVCIKLPKITTADLGIDNINVATYNSCQDSLGRVDAATGVVSSERGRFGAMQNRLEHTIANLGTSAENLQAAESRIRDLDMADEIMAFTKNNILQQAATAMLAQANMAPQSVLQLLG